MLHINSILFFLKSLTAKNGVFLADLIVGQLVQKVPAAYVTRGYIAVFTTRPFHWNPLWVLWIPSTSSHPFCL